ncbi:hypothetical protein UFOVP806_23 [uncultured Caudovirales phage]|uniref:Uncharacterized protein n=1 Tax=uncultured Caudovirales phage TaxID=2100421 RepID=A0A6J5NVI6_9CAUD|nr:hypothetical protein UFOVP806_23 [uncultured Caudovirales phage]
MKLKSITLSIVLALVVSLTASCTDNQRAKMFGGTATIDLPPGRKLVSATWKDEQLWYLTRPATFGEVPVTSTLTESSSYGLLEGEVTFREW